MNIRFVFGSLAILSGIVILIVKAINGFWASGLAGLFAGFTVAFIVLEFEKYWPILLGNFALLLGVIGVFSEHDAFKLDLNKAYFDVVSHLVSASEHCHSIAPKEQDYAVLVCALQRNKNLQSAIFELEKVSKLTPELGLIDTVSSLASTTNQDKCALAFNKIHKMCPNVFIGMNTDSKQILLDQVD